MIEFLENFNESFFEMIDLVALALPFCFAIATILLPIVLCIQYFIRK